jgi:hypothetical protein
MDDQDIETGGPAYHLLKECPEKIAFVKSKSVDLIFL